MNAAATMAYARSSGRPRRLVLDPWLTGSVLALLLIGLVMVASASIGISERELAEPFYYFERQLMFVALGLVAALVGVSVPTQVWEDRSIWLLAGAFVLLILVLTPGLGHEVNGSTPLDPSRRDELPGLGARPRDAPHLDREFRRAPRRRAASRLQGFHETRRCPVRGDDPAARGTRLRRRHGADGHRTRGAVPRRRAFAPPRGPACARRRRNGAARRQLRLSAAPHQGFSRSLGRPVRQRLPAYPVADRDRARRVVRRRPWVERAEALLPARGAHRLRVRGHGGGIRPRRRRAGDRPVRRRWSGARSRSGATRRRRASSSSRTWPRRSASGSGCRRSSTSASTWACCRPRGSRCRSSATAAAACWSRSAGSACWHASTTRPRCRAASWCRARRGGNESARRIHHGGRHGRSRVPRARDGARAAPPRLRHRVARHAARHRGAAGARRGHTRRMAVGRRPARQGRGHAARGTVPAGARDRCRQSTRCAGTGPRSCWARAASPRARVASPRGCCGVRWWCTSRTRSRASPIGCSRGWRTGCSRVFPGSFGPRIRAERVGNPVRPEIAAIAAPEQRYAGREGRARLLVFGGSQGSARLNAVVPAAIAELPGTLRPDVLHQTGSAGLDGDDRGLPQPRPRRRCARLRRRHGGCVWLGGPRGVPLGRAHRRGAGRGRRAGDPRAVSRGRRRSPDAQRRLRGRGGRGGADAGSRRSRRSRSPRSCASCSRPGGRGCSRWRRPRGAPRSPMPTSGSRTPASRWREVRHEEADRMRRINTIHFVGIGGSGMSGIAEVLANLGYAVQGSDLKASDATRRLESLGVRVVLGHQRRERRGRRRRGGVERRGRGQPRGRVRARAAHPGRQARGDARRADAFPVLDRGRRHARQDHDHEPGRERARRRRRGSDLRHRRTPEERGCERAARRRALPGRRGGRERRLVHAPAADDRGGHQRRRRSSRHARRRLRAAQVELRRVPAQPALLRPGGDLQRRPGHREPDTAHRPAVPRLRVRRRRRRARGEPRSSRRAVELRRDPAGPRRRASRSRSTCRAGTTC